MSHVPALMMLPGDSEDVMVQALDLGANDCVRTPHSPPELVARVRRLLKRWFPPPQRPCELEQAQAPASVAAASPATA